VWGVCVPGAHRRKKKKKKGREPAACCFFFIRREKFGGVAAWRPAREGRKKGNGRARSALDATIVINGCGSVSLRDIFVTGKKRQEKKKEEKSGHIRRRESIFTSQAFAPAATGQKRERERDGW